MARRARVVVPGYPHHVTQRGNRRQRVFFDDDDYRNYLTLMAHACGRAQAHVLAYCLMPNHVHLIVVPAGPDGLRGALADAHRRHAIRINQRHDWRGHLWQERFYSFPLDERHLLAATRYIEQNPVAAGLRTRAADWPWSSAQAHLSGNDDALVEVGPLRRLIGDWGRYLAEDADEDVCRQISLHTRTGRPLGDDTFITRVEGIIGRRVGVRDRGRPRKAEIQ